MKNGGCLFFKFPANAEMYQHSQSEGVAWHRRCKGIGDVPPTSKEASRDHGRTARQLAKQQRLRP